MYERYTEPARRVIFFARYEASQFGNAEIPPEFLLLGILREDKELARRLVGESRNVESIRERIERETTRGEKIAVSINLAVSQAGKRALAYGAEEAERLNQPQIAPVHLLIGLLREESLASRILTDLGLTLERLREEAARLIVPPPAPSRRASVSFEPQESASEPVTRDLVALAIAGQLGPLIGRERELDRLIRVLSRRTRSNAVLIGESGVGKRAIVEGLAQRMANGAVPAGLLDRKLLAMDLGVLLDPRRRPRFAAGYYLPEIVFLPGLFDFAVARQDWVSLEAIKVLEPMLARGDVRVIATGTPAGYREAMAKAAPMASQFEVIPVLPPNDDQSLAILHGVKQQYEQFHDVTFSDEAIQAALAASARFLRHRPLPDRALDLLDEAGAYVSLRRAEGDSLEEREVRRRIRIATHKMEHAIFMHEFDRAREFSEQGRQERQVLKQLLEQRQPDTAASGTVTAQDVIEVVAGLAGAPVAVVQSLIAQPDASGIERIVKQLLALVPQGREWLEPLAAYLAGCSPEDAHKLAAAIQNAAEKPKE